MEAAFLDDPRTDRPSAEEIQIVDVLWRVVLTSKSAGQIDASGLPAGVCVVQRVE